MLVMVAYLFAILMIASVLYRLFNSYGWERVETAPNWVRRLMRPGLNATYKGKYYKYRVQWTAKCVMYFTDDMQSPAQYKNEYTAIIKRKKVKSV